MARFLVVLVLVASAPAFASSSPVVVADAPLAVPPPVSAEPAPAPAPAPSASPDQKPSTSTPPKANAAKPAGMDGIVVGAIQTAAGCGTILVFGVCWAIPYVNFCTGPIGCLLMPFAVGGVETVLGDMLGTKRGALLWPIVAAAGGMCGAAVLQLVVGVTAGLLFAGGFVGLSALLSNTSPAVLLPALLATYGLALAIGLITSVIGSTLIAVLPAVAYAFTAEDKKPGDLGQFVFPGITAPAHPTATPVALLPSRTPALAVRY